MSGIKIYNVGLNGIQLSKGMTVQEFNSWIVSTLGGSSSDSFWSVTQSNDGGYVAIGYQNSEGRNQWYQRTGNPAQQDKGRADPRFPFPVQ